MNQGSLNFTLISAMLGMGIVFLFLGLLYLIMSILKIKLDRLFHKERKINSEEKVTQDFEKRRENKTIEWLMAALSAYLEAEQQTETPTAIPWIPKKDTNSIPWITINKIENNGIY